MKYCISIVVIRRPNRVRDSLTLQGRLGGTSFLQALPDERLTEMPTRPKQKAEGHRNKQIRPLRIRLRSSHSESGLELLPGQVGVGRGRQSDEATKPGVQVSAALQPQDLQRNVAQHSAVCASLPNTCFSKASSSAEILMKAMWLLRLFSGQSLRAHGKHRRKAAQNSEDPAVVCCLLDSQPSEISFCVLWGADHCRRVRCFLLQKRQDSSNAISFSK